MLAGGIATQADGAVAVLPLGIAGFLFGGCSAAVFIQFTAPTLICYLNGECRGDVWDRSGTIIENGANTAQGVVNWSVGTLEKAIDTFPPLPKPGSEPETQPEPLPVPGDPGIPPPPPGGGVVLYHYTNSGAITEILDPLSPDKGTLDAPSGVNYLTPDFYTTGAEAKERLAITNKHVDGTYYN